MRHDDYAEHVTDFTDEMKKVTTEKNADYSAGTDDAMCDYHSTANRVGITPVQVWAVLFFKHVHAVERFIKTGMLSSESIHGRFIDIANYGMLGDALVKDIAECHREDAPVNASIIGAGSVTDLDAEMRQELQRRRQKLRDEESSNED